MKLEKQVKNKYSQFSKETKRVILIILDGLGIAPPSEGNAVTLAKMPIFNSLISCYQTKVLEASGEAVGLPSNAAGNSEVGHLNLGAGRIVRENLSRINQSIKDKSFFKNKVINQAIDHVKSNKSSLHLLGLLSNGMVHGDIFHLYTLLKFAYQKKLKNVFIHVILDGRDTPYNSGINFVKELERKIKEIGIGKIATISGRFYAMDRDNHWERIEKAYQAMVYGKSEKYFNNPQQAIEESYKNKIYDEEFLPVVIVDDKNKPVAKIKDNDAVIFFNFREDRARELTKAFVLEKFNKFRRKKIKNLYFATMVEYEKDLPVNVIFPSEKIANPIAKVISDYGLKQLHLAETEKYAHVTFFFNGGKEEPFPNEDRLIIPSPRVSSYALKPEMSAFKVAEKTIEAIESDKYQFIVVNFANPDMVAHTGDIKAAIKALEVVDTLLGDVLTEVEKKKWIALIVADHGNIEEMVDLKTKRINKEHSKNPVPFIIVGDKFRRNSKIKYKDLFSLKPVGILADVAPTILKIMGIPQPKEMTGRALI